MTSPLLEGTSRSRGAWLTEREVWDACSALARQRERVSVRSVREKLGHRGSNATVGKFIKSWEEKARKNPDEVKPEPLSPAPDLLREPMQLLWDRARTEVKEELRSQQEALEVARRELDERHRRDQELIESTRLANQQLQSVITVLGSRLEKLESTSADAKAKTLETLQAIASDFTAGVAQLQEVVTGRLDAQAAHLNDRVDVFQGSIRSISETIGQQAEATRAQTGRIDELGNATRAAADKVAGVSDQLKSLRSDQAKAQEALVDEIRATAGATAQNLREVILEGLSVQSREIAGVAQTQQAIESRISEQLGRISTDMGSALHQVLESTAGVSGTLTAMSDRLGTISSDMARLAQPSPPNRK